MKADKCNVQKGNFPHAATKQSHALVQTSLVTVANAIGEQHKQRADWQIKKSLLTTVDTSNTTLAATKVLSFMLKRQLGRAWWLLP